ncbi:MAG: phospho-N-acetylmuramoyl-pentapeptide-transferase [Bacteroidales bacterium]|nr:phospho-N-acetylmuramoyl-pentapeptide-transferase [Bacteroidales bacterium]MBR4715525.1 phospho-N-acetylmuramoyl-pentapeptide-transferase [Bacteroidales bacterium]MCR4931233.1 phospho-N-acetylmuramoyl-pentapeptide-transferase [Bacteroidales bacterium]
MLYYLFTWLDKAFNFPGAGVFQYISFRAAMSVITSLIIMLIFGKPFIKWLRKKQIGETVRDLKLEGQKEKEGTPTMGGLLILAAIVIPTLLFAKLDNIYVLIMLGTTVWLGLIGFIDDYIKVFKKHKEGLRGKYKVIGQVLLGLAVGLLIMYHPDITIKETSSVESYVASHNVNIGDNFERAKSEFAKDPIKSTKTTIPFVKSNELDYAKTITWMGDWAKKWVWLVYVIIVIFVVTATSNGANLTDGIDGLATGTSAIIGSTLAILAWVSGNIIFANYLNIMFLPNIGELAIFITAFVGATLGFLWYNSHPAEIFMGDTGSLAIGGIIAVFALLIRKELLIPIMCGIFLMESLSVIIQTTHFKRTKKKYGEGRRVFLMAPLHHHYQKKGIKEEKIVMRFYLIGILLAVISIVTLKLR